MKNAAKTLPPLAVTNEGAPAGELDWFAALYREHHRAVRSVLFRFGVEDDLDDLVQEVFIKVHATWGSFRGDASPKTWIVRIAINTAKDHRKRRRPRGTADGLAPLAAPRGPDTDVAGVIDGALAQLSEDMRSVFILCVIEEYSMLEAAEILGVPEGTVKSRLHTARREVREHLRRKGYEP